MAHLIARIEKEVAAEAAYFWELQFDEERFMEDVVGELESRSNEAAAVREAARLVLIRHTQTCLNRLRECESVIWRKATTPQRKR